MSTNTDFESALLQLLPALHSFAKTMCQQTTDAEDLVQETLFKALRSRDKYVPFGTLESWLFTIMKNTFCNKIRRVRREATIQEWEGPTIGPSQEWAMELQDVGRSIVRLQHMKPGVSSDYDAASFSPRCISCHESFCALDGDNTGTFDR